MVSVIAGLVIACGVTCIALYKGRTGWHWFVLSVLAFAAVWIMSAVGLYLAGVHRSFGAGERGLAAFTGMITLVVIGVILIAVPVRPRRHAPIKDPPQPPTR